MWDKLKNLGEKAKEAISTTAVLVGDLNGDGKVDDEDARIATEWAKETATSVGNEASRITKEALNSDMAKDAAGGAAVGAAIALPVPFIGPMAGAAIGAGVGVYKNLTKKDSPAHPSFVETKKQIDFHDELLKLDDLRKKGIISEVEFEIQKKRVLDART
jgi:hypothetical protein